MWMASCRYVRTLYEPSKFKAIMRRIQPGGRGHTTPACVGRRKCIISSERETSAKIVPSRSCPRSANVFLNSFLYLCCLLGCPGLVFFFFSQLGFLFVGAVLLHNRTLGRRTLDSFASDGGTVRCLHQPPVFI